jgi:hypothetical protein
MNSYTDIDAQKLKEKLEEYTDPAKYYLDIFPNCTEQQIQILTLFLNKQFNKFEVPGNRPFTYDTFAKLAFYSFLSNPTSVTLVVLPPKKRWLSLIIRKALIEVIHSFKDIVERGEFYYPNLHITETNISLYKVPNSGIQIKNLSQNNLFGYDANTNILIFNDRDNASAWDSLCSVPYNKFVLFTVV